MANGHVWKELQAPDGEGLRRKVGPRAGFVSCVFSPWLLHRLHVCVFVCSLRGAASLRMALGHRGSFSSSPGWRRTSIPARTSSLRCPSCERDVELGDRGLSLLFRNFTLESIVERFRQAARSAAAVPCSVCVSQGTLPPRDATKSCMDCQTSFCNHCFKLNHPWGTPKATHEALGPTTSFRPRVLMCPEHEMEKVNMYCEVCRRPVCHLCKLGGVHANHRVTSMSSAYKILKEKLSKSISYLISKEDQVRTQISELEERIRLTEENAALAERGVQEQFERISSALSERQGSILAVLSQERASRLQRLQAQREQYQGLLESSGLVGFAQEVLKEPEQSCFLQTAKLLHLRIQKATESLRTFQPAASASFHEFTVDTAREEALVREIDFSTVLDLTRSRIYNEAAVHWSVCEDLHPGDTHTLQFRPLCPGEEERETEEVELNEEHQWRTIEGLRGSSTVVSGLEPDTFYSFRVKSCRDTHAHSLHSPYSPSVRLHTPPATVLCFLFSERGFDSERLLVAKRRDSVQSVAGVNQLLSSERVQTGSFISMEFIVGDTGVTGGRHFWAFGVQSDSFMVKVGVASDSKIAEWHHNPRDSSSPRYDHDSGHDSGSEDASFEVSQPYTLLTVGMGRIIIPKPHAGAGPDQGRVLPSAGSGADQSRVISMPHRIGVLLDYEAGCVSFYDADCMRCLCQRPVECTGTMYPAFGLLGGGSVRLEEPVSSGKLQFY
ncbi:hypothetical protein DNTS_004403 [Danionella cerebrum]|uniref:Uncharacterized protein n=1 Tax=Danionella cerebrum TaxID=2873325 RepID=A0A553NH71_9TELE|nr:hypothetical protein DNTS_004403 [Danionella translucida]